MSTQIKTPEEIADDLLAENLANACCGGHCENAPAASLTDEELAGWMTAAIEADRAQRAGFAITAAARLIEDGERGAIERNPEYARGIFELIQDTLGGDKVDVEIDVRREMEAAQWGEKLISFDAGRPDLDGTLYYLHGEHAVRLLESWTEE